MAWFKVDDGFANSRPVLRIPRRHRAAVVGLWTLAGTWSAKELTDGHVPEYVLEEVCGTPSLAGLLVKVGLWDVAPDGDGWQFIGWEKYQPMRAEVLARRAAETERKRSYREKKSARRRPSPDDSESVMEVHSKRAENVLGTYSESDSLDEGGETSPSFSPSGTGRGADQGECEMSQRDSGGTTPGQTEGRGRDSDHPDPTRPDPTNYYVVEPLDTAASQPVQDDDGFAYEGDLLAETAAAPKEVRKAQTPRPDVDALCERLHGRIVGNGNRAGKITETWRTAARLLLDRDGVTVAQAEAVIDWCQTDEFWSPNILSMPTFRKQYAKLEAKARAAHRATHAPTPAPSRRQAQRDSLDAIIAEMSGQDPAPSILGAIEAAPRHLHAIEGISA